ncbi:SRPBCC family protein [Micromonospora sp. WMMC241]|uniref:SRPBCC family protein n=1 Tax=Micromonospora sp. WMMC241 TaxID=3015159 RepID=UPI0022B753D6|nr:SRPBCC family protein [Micromonospora sp. WMMC241]MCZ7437308.1 SRPBCC family protein [Micromonospora sp. WMMC241]
MAQLAAPDKVRRISGVDDSPTSRVVVPLVGARELVHAAGLLTSRRKGVWAWTRVVGDAMDLTSLGMALAHRGGRRRRRLVGVTGAILGITVLDVLTAVQATRAKETASGSAVRGVRRGGPMELTATTTVRKPPSEVYEFWRELGNLPTFMAHLEEVRVTGGRTSHWSASAPFGRNVEWDAEITDEAPGEKIAWRSTGSADVPNAGTVRFVPAPDGVSTQVRVVLSYDIPGGAVGKAVAKYFGEEPHQQLDDDLRRFKQVLETGEVVRSDGAPWGKRARKEFPQRAAQPLSDAELAKGADA